DPETRAVRALGKLPAPTTHAGAAALGNRALVVGGRSAGPNTPTARIVAVDPLSGRIRIVGRLPQPLSDAAVATLGRTVMVAGGRNRTTLAGLTSLGAVTARTPRARRPPTPHATPLAVNVYAHDGANAFSRVVRNVPPRVYVPNSASNTVDVIDQRTFKIVAHYRVGLLPQHVTPSYDLKTLWVDNDVGNSLTPVSPITGRPKGRPVHVSDPYNLYFTPDGRYAIVVAEREHGLYVTNRNEGTISVLDFATRKLVAKWNVGGSPDMGGVSADGKVLWLSARYDAQVYAISTKDGRVLARISVGYGPHGVCVWPQPG